MADIHIHQGRLEGLNSDQLVALKQFWRKLFDRLDNPTQDEQNLLSDPTSTPDPTFTSPPTSPRHDAPLKPSRLHDELWNSCAQDDPDVTALRFLRARKYDVDKSVDMMMAALCWRVRFDVKSVMEGGETLLPKWQWESGVNFFHGTDNEGRPVCYINTKFHDKSASTFLENQKFTVFVMETARQLLPPPTETVTVVFDLTDFSTSNMDFPFIKFLVTCFEAYYPESLGTCLILNAPMIFGGIWRLIKPLLDANVARKIHFVKTSQLADHIPPAHIPISHVGQHPYTYKYIPPTEDDAPLPKDQVYEEIQNERMEAVREFTEGTSEWIEKEGTLRHPSREKAKVILKETWYRMEEYKPKNLYWRLGKLASGGVVDLNK